MRMELNNDFCRQFGIRYPIFQAGMAGGPTTPDLVAAVSNAGGLGTLGAAYMEPAAIRAAIADIRGRTSAPFAVNLFTVPMEDDNRRTAEVQRVLDSIRDDLGLPPALPQAVQTPDHLERQFSEVLEAGVPVISTAFGVLSPRHMELAKTAGMKVVAMATTVEEALEAERAGCDAVVAQGSEAGGHRGTFNVDAHPMGANIGTFALVPQIADRVSIPVIAAGGIMDGRGMVAAMVLGAQAVQMGTRFLTAAESGAHPAYQAALLASTEESTVLTKAFSGRPARGIANAFVREWNQSGVEPLPFPTQNTATRDIRNAAARQNQAGYMSLWAGQATRMLKAGQSAADIVEETVRQALEILKS